MLDQQLLSWCHDLPDRPYRSPMKKKRTFCAPEAARTLQGLPPRTVLRVLRLLACDDIARLEGSCSLLYSSSSDDGSSTAPSLLEECATERLTTGGTVCRALRVSPPQSPPGLCCAPPQAASLLAHARGDRQAAAGAGAVAAAGSSTAAAATPASPQQLHETAAFSLLWLSLSRSRARWRLRAFVGRGRGMGWMWGVPSGAHCAAGANHTLLLAVRGGQVLSCGDTERGATGRGDGVTAQLSPAPLRLLRQPPCSIALEAVELQAAASVDTRVAPRGGARSSAMSPGCSLTDAHSGAQRIDAQASADGQQPLAEAGGDHRGGDHSNPPATAAERHDWLKGGGGSDGSTRAGAGGAMSKKPGSSRARAPPAEQHHVVQVSAGRAASALVTAQGRVVVCGTGLGFDEREDWLPPAASLALPRQRRQRQPLNSPTLVMEQSSQPLQEQGLLRRAMRGRRRLRAGEVAEGGATDTTAAARACNRNDDEDGTGAEDEPISSASQAASPPASSPDAVLQRRQGRSNDVGSEEAVNAGVEDGALAGRLSFRSSCGTSSGSRSFFLQPPMRLQQRWRVVTTAVGDSHIIVVAATGEAFSCGSGRDGRLGLGDVCDRSRLACVRHFACADADGQGQCDVPIVGAAAGMRHTLLLDVAGRVFSCGASGSGELGHGDRVRQLLPQQILSFMPAPRWGHAAPLLVDDAVAPASTAAAAVAVAMNPVAGPGAAADGTLAQQQRALPAIAQVSAGQLHSALVSTDGRLLTCGWGGDGRLGTGNEQWQLRPRQVQSDCPFAPHKTITRPHSDVNPRPPLSHAASPGAFAHRRVFPRRCGPDYAVLLQCRCVRLVAYRGAHTRRQRVHIWLRAQWPARAPWRARGVPSGAAAA